MRRFSLLVILLLGAAALVWAADWAQFRGPSFSGQAPDSGINKSWNRNAPRQLWQVHMSDNGYSGPSVANGKLYIVDHVGKQDIVCAFDATTGRQAWRFPYNEPLGDNYGFARATPSVANGKVVTVSRSGQVYCLDAGSGRQVWMLNLVTTFGGKRPTWDYSMSALIDGNKVILVPGGPNAAVAAVDLNSGRVLWKGGGSDGASYATPVKATINGKVQYVIFNVGGLVGVDANSGAKIWSFPWRTGCDVNAAVPLVIDNNVFITSGYGHGCAMVQVNGSSAKQLWMNRTMQAHFNSPFYYGGCIFGTGDPGNLVCLDPKTGRQLWVKQDFEKGGLVGVDGTLIVLNGRSGEVTQAALTSKGYQELGKMRGLGGQSWTAPIVANGKLYIRNKSTLACYALK
jgi:outer membrane protein assembly factor BamB